MTNKAEPCASGGPIIDAEASYLADRIDQWSTLQLAKLSASDRAELAASCSSMVARIERASSSHSSTGEKQ